MKFLEKLNLKENKQKSDLIQTLLIVSSILVALRPPQSVLLPDHLNGVFMTFIILSIFYYVFIQNDFEPNIYANLMVVLISATFSTLVNVNILIIFLKNLSLSLSLIFYLIYYLILTVVLWAALVKR